jgi:hypothetical protein
MGGLAVDELGVDAQAASEVDVGCGVHRGLPMSGLHGQRATTVYPRAIAAGQQRSTTAH